MILPAFAFVGMAVASPKSASLMTIVGISCFVAWSVGYFGGDHNYQSLLRPYYDINQLNTYPNVDPLAYSGTQVMDAGKINFAPGSQIQLKYSQGFKNGDVYCVAPIGKGGNA